MNIRRINFIHETKDKPTENDLKAFQELQGYPVSIHGFYDLIVQYDQDGSVWIATWQVNLFD